MKFFSLLFIGIFLVTRLSAQDEDLLKLLGKEKPKKQLIKYAFKSPRIINGHSIEFLNPGTMDFRIMHNFGPLSSGVQNLYGLDVATMRMSFDFGLAKSLMIGVGRSTYKKELDGFIKYAPIRQSTGPWSSPITVALVAGMTLNTLPWADTSIKNYFSSRLAFYYQVLIGRKFSEGFTLQISPTMVHRNLVQYATDSNDVYALGIGGRLKLSNRVAFTWDYFYLMNILNGKVPTGVTNPLSVGFDIETGGHIFQLHFSNTAGMNERAFLTETTNSWSKFQVSFGFNLSRVFQLKHKKSF